MMHGVEPWRRRGLSDYLHDIVDNHKDVWYTKRILQHYNIRRRGGISFDRTEQAAIYVRMLGDVRVSKHFTTKPCGIRRTSIPDHEMKIIEALESNVRRTSLKHSRALSLPRIIARPIPKTKFYERPEPRPLLDSRYNGQITQLLHRLNHWDFNVFHLQQVTGAHSLRNILMHLFHEYGLIQEFNLDPLSVYRTAVLIENGYHSNNPYHNALHAADVTQAMHCYLQLKQIRTILTPLEIMSAILAAAAHDLDHPGVNQVYLIATKNHLAKLYRKTSVLENHHWRAALSVFKETKVFDHLDSKTWDALVENISSLILATDISRQQEFLSRLRVFSCSGILEIELEMVKYLRKPEKKKDAHRGKHLDNSDLDFNDPKHRHFIIQIALKCADICNPCRQWMVTKKWAEMVVEEFFNQGDQEKKQNLTVTQSCDRFKTTIGKIQTGFITYVVEPLFLEWERFLPSGLSRKMLYNVRKNKAAWEVVLEQEKPVTEQQGAITSGPTDRKSSSGSSSQGEVDTIATTTTPGNNNSFSVAKIIVDGRPAATITAIRSEQTRTVPSEMKAITLGTVTESSLGNVEAVPDVTGSTLDTEAVCDDTDSVTKSAIASPPPPPPVVSETPPKSEKSEESSQVKRIIRTPPETEQQQPAEIHISSTSTSTTEIRSPVIARLKGGGGASRSRAPSMETVGSTQHEAVDTRPRASTATSSRESKTTQLGGIHTPSTQRGARAGPSHFNLRLFRNPGHHSSPKSLQSFGDPWVARDSRTRSPTSSISSYSQMDLPDQKCAITSGSGSGSHRTPPLTDGDVRTCCDGSSGMVLTGGINNNVDVHHAAKGQQQQDKQKPAKIGSLDRFQRITGIRADTRVSSSPTIGTRSASGLSSATSPRYRELTHSRTDPSQLRTGSGRVLSPDIPRRRELSATEITLAGKSLAERGSPWIRRRMEQRQNKADALRKEAAASAASGTTSGNLSQSRFTTKTLQQSHEQWYSVPPALGPLYHDFATTQLELASIAQHKKQSQDTLPSSPSLPSESGGRLKGKLQHSSSMGSS